MALEPKLKNRIEVDGESLTPAVLRNRYLKLKKQMDDMNEKHHCVMCGSYKIRENFYLQRNSNYDSKISFICKDCLWDIIYQKDEYGVRHKASRKSLIQGLCYFNKPFYTQLYEECVAEESSSLKQLDFAKLYLNKINAPKYEGQSFLDSDLLVTKEVIVSDTSEFDNETKQQLYRDIKDVVEIVGYDPFVRENASDKPFLYSQLLALIDDNDDSDRDVYKIQSCISITRDFLKMQKYDNMITEMLNDPAKLSGSSSIKMMNDLNTTKTNLQNTINKTAAENNLSEKGNKRSIRGDKSWTGKLKAMKDLNLRDAEINGFDLGTSKGMRQILDLSHESILSQLKLQDNEYAEMLAEQRTMLKEAQEKADLNEELFRLVLRENVDLKKLLAEHDISIRNDSVPIDQLINEVTEQVKEKFSEHNPV